MNSACWFSDAGSAGAALGKGGAFASCPTTSTVYFHGGHHAGGTGAALWRYKLEHPRWKEVSAAAVEDGSPARTQHAAVVTDDGRFLLHGGRDATGAVCSSAFEFDPATKTWLALDTVSAGCAPPAMQGHAMVRAEHDTVIVVGPPDAKRKRGARATAAAALEVYVLQTSAAAKRWEKLPTRNGMAYPQRRGFSAAYCNGQLVVAGGRVNGSPVADMWALDVAEGTWRQVALSAQCAPSQILPPVSAAHSHLLPLGDAVLVVGREDCSCVSLADGSVTSHRWSYASGALQHVFEIDAKFTEACTRALQGRLSKLQGAQRGPIIGVAGVSASGAVVRGAVVVPAAAALASGAGDDSEGDSALFEGAAASTSSSAANSSGPTSYSSDSSSSSSSDSDEEDDSSCDDSSLFGS